MDGSVEIQCWFGRNALGRASVATPYYWSWIMSHGPLARGKWIWIASCLFRGPPDDTIQLQIQAKTTPGSRSDLELDWTTLGHNGSIQAIPLLTSADNSLVEVNLRRAHDGSRVSGERVDQLFDELLEPMALPKPIIEKIGQMHVKVRPCVPDAFCDDPLYAASSEEQQHEAKSIKRVREECDGPHSTKHEEAC